ncbi:hypothetical protein H1Q59_05115 [Holosporaceae bacterium 'Namur']|nr:hypothetical protein [Holosporaceae bacterium 'Namur']
MMYIDIILILSVLVIQCIYYSIDFYKIETTNRVLKNLIISFLVLISISTSLGLVNEGVLINSKNYLLKMTLNYMNLVCLGVAVAITWNMCAAMFNSRLFTYIMFIFSIVTLVLYFIAVVEVSSEFVIAVLYYSMAAFNMLVIFLVCFANNLSKNIIPGILGIFLLVLASCLEQAGFSIKFLGLSSTAVLHILICIAFYMIFSTLKYILITNVNTRISNAASNHSNIIYNI